MSTKLLFTKKIKNLIFCYTFSPLTPAPHALQPHPQKKPSVWLNLKESSWSGAVWRQGWNLTRTGGHFPPEVPEVQALEDEDAGVWFATVLLGISDQLFIHLLAGRSFRLLNNGRTKCKFISFFKLFFRFRELRQLTVISFNFVIIFSFSLVAQRIPFFRAYTASCFKFSLSTGEYYQ